MSEINAFEKFSKREWAMALVGLTPGGSEFLTPDECTYYIRKSRAYSSIIVELRKQNAELRNAAKDALETIRRCPDPAPGQPLAYRVTVMEELSKALAQEPR